MPPNLSNHYFQQQFQNSQQQQSNTNYQHDSFSPIQSLPKQNPNNNIPLPENPAFVPQSEAERPFHGFPIIYDDYTFYVDPFSLIKESFRFKELIGPYVNDYTQMKEIHLLIHGNQFTRRNMNNFLRICQQLQTDVKNNEMKEICEIAKMFQADAIYNKGLAFIQANEDPNFKDQMEFHT